MCVHTLTYLFIIFLPPYPSSLFPCIYLSFHLCPHIHLPPSIAFFSLRPYSVTEKYICHPPPPPWRERVTKGMLVTVLIHQCQVLISTEGLTLISSVSYVFVIVATFTDSHSWILIKDLVCFSAFCWVVSFYWSIYRVHNFGIWFDIEIQYVSDRHTHHSRIMQVQDFCK